MSDRHPSLLHLFATDANADRPALRCEGDSLSYGALDQRAARLATVLTSAGVRRGDRVAIFLDKSFASFIAIYGILRAGAAYVPIDPVAPPERVRTILAECSARAIITAEPKRRALPTSMPESVVAVIGLDRPLDKGPDTVSWDEVAGAPEAPAHLADTSELDLAYIIFSSGSTGVPKGIMHTHQSGGSFARMAAALFDVRPEDRLSNASPLHFDMSLFDVFASSLRQATTVIVPEPYLMMPASLTELIVEEELTIWYSVPFALTQMLLHGDLAARDMSRIRWVIFGGEPFSVTHLERLRPLFPKATFSNSYGPAETNQCTYYHLPASWRAADGQPSIGIACQNAETLILDDAERSSATGELVVRAPTMMRGYWNRPDLNARAFYRQPGAGGIEDVYYRTGDLVRRETDGTLSFLGRKDRQIKTRGFRVELDEIEHALTQLEAVAEAAAFPVDADEGLVLPEAAVVLRNGASFSESALASAVGATLPSYARPARIHLFETFPRTSSGKIDRRAVAARARAPADTV